jgi:hypothetical protein
VASARLPARRFFLFDTTEDQDAMNLLDLPRDIIVEIGSYIVCNEDIFS